MRRMTQRRGAGRGPASHPAPRRRPVRTSGGDGSVARNAGGDAATASSAVRTSGGDGSVARDGAGDRRSRTRRGLAGPQPRRAEGDRRAAACAVLGLDPAGRRRQRGVPRGGRARYARTAGTSTRPAAVGRARHRNRASRRERRGRRVAADAGSRTSFVRARFRPRERRGRRVAADAGDAGRRRSGRRLGAGAIERRPADGRAFRASRREALLCCETSWGAGAYESRHDEVAKAAAVPALYGEGVSPCPAAPGAGRRVAPPFRRCGRMVLSAPESSSRAAASTRRRRRRRCGRGCRIRAACAASGARCA